MWKVADLKVTTDNREREGCSLVANDEMDGVFVAMGTTVIEIPKIAILEIVGYYVRKRMSAKWESMADTKVLDHLMNNVVFIQPLKD